LRPAAASQIQILLTDSTYLQPIRVRVMNVGPVLTDARERVVAGMSVRVALLLGIVLSVALYLFFYRPRGDFDYNFGYGYGRDFVNFWAAGRLTGDGLAAVLSSPVAYNVWLKSTFGPEVGLFHVFSYPPTVLALLVPFGMFGYGAALALWTLANVAAAGVAMRVSLADWRPAVTLAVVSPAIALNGMQGQICGFTGALFFAALMLLDRRPIASGVCLGLLTIKPHLGIVAGLIVLMERRWLTVFATLATAAVLVVVSIMIAGSEAWSGYVGSTLAVQKVYLEKMSAGFRYFLVTPYAVLREMGVSGSAALVLHGVAALSAVSAALWIWRHVGDRLFAVLIAGVASVVVTPYANLYDLVLVALPLAGLIVRDGAAGLGARERGYLLWVLPAIGLPLAILVGPLAPIVLLVVGGAIAVSGLSDVRPRARAAE
jgi:hypothetical protein